MPHDLWHQALSPRQVIDSKRFTCLTVIFRRWKVRFYFWVYLSETKKKGFTQGCNIFTFLLESQMKHSGQINCIKPFLSVKTAIYFRSFDFFSVFPLRMFSLGEKNAFLLKIASPIFKRTCNNSFLWATDSYNFNFLQAQAVNTPIFQGGKVLQFTTNFEHDS